MRKFKVSLAAMALAATGLMPISHAQVTDVNWGGSTGNRNWQDNANWIGGAFPNDALKRANLSVALPSNLTVDIGPTDITIARLALGSTTNAITTAITNTTTPASRLIFQNDDDEILSNVLDADFNNDTVITGRDFLIWQRGFGVTGDNINNRGDANNDDVVDAADLAIWQDQYGLGAGLFNIGTPGIESGGVPGAINRIDADIHIKSRPAELNNTNTPPGQLEFAGDNDLVINGDITYEGDPTAEVAGASNAGFRVLTSGMTVTMNGNIVIFNADGVDGSDFFINNHPEAGGTFHLNGMITGEGDLEVGSTSSGGTLGTVYLNGPSTYTGSFRAGRGNLVLNHNDALGKSNVLNDNGTPGDTSDDFFPRASYRQVGPANVTGYNMISTADDRVISNEIVMAQWQTIAGEHSITFDGHVTQTNNRGIVNELPAGKTVNITGELDIFDSVESGIRRQFTFDGPGKTIVTAEIRDTETSPATGFDYGLRKRGTGVVVIDVNAGENNHSGYTIVERGNLHFADNDSLNASTDIKAKIRSVAGAVGVDVHPAGQTLASNATFISKIEFGSTGGLMLAPTDTATNINFAAAALNNVEQMSLAAPETGITYTGTITPNASQYRLGGGQGTLTLPNAQLTTATRSLSVRNGGTVRLLGANTYEQFTIIEGKYSATMQSADNAIAGDEGGFLTPVLEVNTLANGGANSSIGKSTNAASNLIIQGGTLRYIGTGSTTDRLFTIGTHGGTIESSGTGPVVFTNGGAAAAADVGPVTATLDDAARNPNVLYEVSNSRDIVIGMTLSDPNPANPNTDFISILNPCSNTNGANCIPAVDAEGDPVVVTGVSDDGKQVGFSVDTKDIYKENTSIVFGTVARTFSLGGTNTGANIISPVISNSAQGSVVGITKKGTGTWYLEGNNTNTGPTLVEAGTLGGNGAVGGALTVNAGATFVPGTAGVANGVGDFSVGGAFTLDSGSILGIQLGGTGAAQYDKLNVTGAAILRGAINLSTVAGFSPALSNQFTVLTAAGGITDEGLTITGLTGFTKSIVGNSLILTKTAALTALAAVPEPGSMTLIGMTLAFLGLRRKSA